MAGFWCRADGGGRVCFLHEAEKQPNDYGQEGGKALSKVMAEVHERRCVRDASA